jgi:polysaccharide pyruvyl transferase WcaK-like protein
MHDKKIPEIIDLHSKKKTVKVLLVGYNGANNTGSESRLISIIEDLRNIIGKNVIITIPTLNEKNLRRYITESETLKIVPIPTLYFFAIRKLVKENDLVLLVEGSCYMDTWTSALLWAFLWATRCAKSFGKICIAYAVDAGELSPINKWFVRKEASKTDLIITRSDKAAEKLISIGVTAPIQVTADTAFYFKEEIADHNTLSKIWSINDNIVGIAMVDFTLWPVIIRPWGRKKDLYKWPYYFPRSSEREKNRKKLIDGWANIANHFIVNYGKKVALICMEDLDTPLAMEICNKVNKSDECIVITSQKLNASQMTSVLMKLDLLITSRYHASILSLRAKVPQIAVGHDPRLKSFYQDINMFEEYFISHHSPKLWDNIKSKVDLLLNNPKIQYKNLNLGLKQQLKLSKKNKEYLRNILEKNNIMVKE